MAKKFFSIFLVCCLAFVMVSQDSTGDLKTVANTQGKDFIQWVDFDVTYQALEDAMNVDIETFQQDLHINWVEILAYLATKYGGDFSLYSRQDMDQLCSRLNEGASMEELTKKNHYYPYYYQAYRAVIGNLLGMDQDGNYGLTAFSPIGAGYWYTDSDDFGNGRDYGFARKHLGHDMFCSTGTPVAAVEGGKVEALGWNQYGGWRIGIRSHDGFRYYYYAHLRKDSPYAKGLKEGDVVKAGQIIAYTGQTGYSIKENVNNINVPHLHFGMQLIFDESQKECNAEIWIDTYPLIRLLSRHKSEGMRQVNRPLAAPQASPKESAVPMDPVNVPILMYHGLTNKESRVNDYFIPTYTFESDLKYLKEKGYTTITMTDLIDYVNDKTGSVRLPSKPVVLTFDDGYYNNYAFATPLLEKYKMKAVISLIGYASEEASNTEYRSEAYCNVDWSQVRAMSDSGIWEIQNHTYHLHQAKGERKGAKQKTGESNATYEKFLTADLTKLQKQIQSVTNTTPNTFVWPFGAVAIEPAKALQKMGFRATLSCNSGVNRIKKGDTQVLYQLKRNLRSPKANLSKLLGEV